MIVSRWNFSFSEGGGRDRERETRDSEKRKKESPPIKASPCVVHGLRRKLESGIKEREGWREGGRRRERDWDGHSAAGAEMGVLSRGLPPG